MMAKLLGVLDHQLYVYTRVDDDGGHLLDEVRRTHEGQDTLVNAHFVAVVGRGAVAAGTTPDCEL
jgi:hypothetical protein